MRTNEEIATHLQQISHLFMKSKLPGDNYRSTAFSKAAGEIRARKDTKLLNDDYTIAVKIPGVGEAIRDTIVEFAKSGDSAKMRKLKARLPDEVVERFDAKVCKRKVNELLKPLTDAGIDWDYAGSMRRRLPNVRDVDVIVCLDQNAEVAAKQRVLIMNTITNAGLAPDIRDGEQKVGVSIPIASQGRSFTLDLNFCAPENRGAYYVYYTGPKAFNIAMRGDAKARGWKLNQYGVFDENGNNLGSKTEQDVFAAMRMDFIEPEKRA